MTGFALYAPKNRNTRELAGAYDNRGDIKKRVNSIEWVLQFIYVLYQLSEYTSQSKRYTLKSNK